MKLTVNPKIFIQNSKTHGVGVFTNAGIKEGELIEQCYVIHPKNKFDVVIDEVFKEYFFSWPALRSDWKSLLKNQDSLSLTQISYPVCVTGFGMIYNHAKRNNLKVSIDIENNFIEFRASRDIEKDEELFINYGPIFQNILNNERQN